MVLYIHKGKGDTIMNEILTLTALVFFGSMLLNVILNTIKSIVTITGTTFAAALINAITFSFYAVVVKQIADVSLIISVPLTFIANFCGVYIAKWLLAKTTKDKLWRISCTITPKKRIALHDFEKYLFDNNIDYNIVSIYSKYDYILDIFSYNQKQSIIIKEIIEKHKIKYTVTECDKSL